MKPLFSIFSVLLIAGLSACGSDDSDGSVDNGPPPSFGATGTVVDFETGDPVTAATVTVEGILPAPKITTKGADFTLDGIPPASVFYMLSSAPDYVNTYNKAIELIDADQTGLKAEVVKQTYLDGLATAFNVTVDTQKSVLIGRVVDDAGAPLEGVLKENFAIPEQTVMDGPFFLDDDGNPALALTATSKSGVFVIFNLSPEPVAIAAATDAAYGLSMPVSPAAAGTVTLADVVAIEGGAIPPLPKDVSFTTQVYPIFARRACAACHDKKAVGAAIGGLDLAHNKVDFVHRELTTELSPSTNLIRINPADPAASLILTKPGPPAGDHPNLTFASTDDPDYQLILVWITEGAKLN